MRMNNVDPTRLAQLLDEHGPALELFARQWCHSPGDVVQEAFLRLIRQTPWPENVVAWLYTVVRNGAISASRSENRRIKHEQRAAESTQKWFDKTEEFPLDVESVAGALLGLPIEEREVIVTHLWGGRSFEEIAKLVGTSSSTAHRRYQSGLARLKQLLEEPCQTANPHPKNC
jgi:RNA polymerase sigma factor (sigma-70 family)